MESRFTPDEMLSIFRQYIKTHRISRKAIADTLGYTTTQTVTNFFSSGRYFNQEQADALSEKFGINPDFLTNGEGSIESEKAMIEANRDRFIYDDFELVKRCYKDTINVFCNNKASEVYTLLSQILIIHSDENINDPDKTIQRYLLDRIKEILKEEMERQGKEITLETQNAFL